MGIKSDKTFEEIVERFAALVGPRPAGHGTKADSAVAAPDPPETNAAPPVKTSFDQKKR